MTPVIRIDDEVYDELKKWAISFGLVFESPNATLRKVFGMNSESLNAPKIQNRDEFGDTIEIGFIPSNREYNRILIPKDKRHFFPGYRNPFELITDIDTFTTKVTGAPKGPEGDPDAGRRIRGKLGPWLAAHPELKAGDKLRIQALVPGKRYDLSIVSIITNEKRS